MKLRNDTKVEILRFLWRKDGESYIVWRENGPNFVELSEESLAALRLLQKGKRLQEVSHILKKKYGESYNVKRLVSEFTQLWSVPRSKRYIPFLAGMLNDGLLIAMAIILLWLSDLGLTARIEPIYTFAKFLVLVLSLGIMWQFLFFVRTDIYYVVSNMLSCRNLYDDSWNLILNTVLSPLGLEAKSTDISSRELRIIKLYAPFMLTATALSISVFTLFGLSILFQVLFKGIQMLSLSYEANLPNFTEGLLLMCLASLHIAGFLYFLVHGFLNVRHRISEYRTRTHEP